MPPAKTSGIIKGALSLTKNWDGAFCIPWPESRPFMLAATLNLRADITSTLARLRIARLVDPDHNINPAHYHTGCEICTCERRLDWLLTQVPRMTHTGNTLCA